VHKEEACDCVLQGEKSTLCLRKKAIIFTHRKVVKYSGLRTVTRLKVKFPYIHWVTPDDNFPCPENVSAIGAWFLPAQYRATLQSPEISGECCCSKSAMVGFDTVSSGLQSRHSTTAPRMLIPLSEKY